MTELTIGEGERLWTLGQLVSIRLTGDASGDRLAIVEHLAPGGLATPLHAQPLADETFCVLEGRVAAIVGDRESTLDAGAVAFVPRGTPHAVRVLSEHARLLTVHNPAGQERFFRAAGEPAQAVTLPPAAGPPDFERVAAAAAAHDVEILGPPPWPDA